jgi:chromosome partitioning protein
MAGDQSLQELRFLPTAVQRGLEFAPLCCTIVFLRWLDQDSVSDYLLALGFLFLAVGARVRLSSLLARVGGGEPPELEGWGDAAIAVCAFGAAIGLMWALGVHGLVPALLIVIVLMALGGIVIEALRRGEVGRIARPSATSPDPRRRANPADALEGIMHARANRAPVMGLFDRKSANGASAEPARAKEPEAPVTPTAKVIAFTNQKGGVAKTTTTLNLAAAFVERGNRVLCVDLDPQANLTMSQGIDPDTLETSIYDVLVHQVSIREIIRKREVDVACASIDLAGAEIAMSTMIGRERSLKKALSKIAEDYDFVFIDTPPSLGLLTINALTASHKVIVPVQCEYLSMRGLIQLQNTLSMVREELNPEIEIEGILPTLVDNRTVHAKEAIEILEENFGDRVFASRINKTVRFAEAPVKGMSVLKYDPDGKAAYAYRQLAEEVLANGKR